MIDLAGQARLATEALGHAGEGAQIPAQDLEGHRATQADLLGEIHLAHPATGQRPQQPEPAFEHQIARGEHGLSILATRPGGRQPAVGSLGPRLRKGFAFRLGSNVPEGRLVG